MSNEHVAAPFRSILESVVPKAGGGAGGPSRSLHTPLEWFPQTPKHGGTFAIWTAKSTEGRWDGDEDGREWACGYAIHLAPDPFTGKIPFSLFTDDGKGNGDGLGDYDTLAEAQAAANRHDADPWTFEKAMKESSQPPHEAARTREANTRIADRMLADAMAAPAPLQSGGKLWRLSDILEGRTWGDETTLAMIADELREFGPEWTMDAARVRLASTSTNLADIVRRMRVEARRMDRAWMAQATATMHEYAGKAVQP